MCRVLLVDDDPDFSKIARELLAELGCRVTTADSVSAASTVVKRIPFDLLILDFMLPDGNGLNVIDHIPSRYKPKHTAIVTGNGSVQALVKTLDGPRISYLLKPLNIQHLQDIVARVDGSAEPPSPAANTELNKTPTPTTSTTESNRHFGLLVGESEPMQTLYQMIERVAKTNANVMIFGESGVGKELVAAAIHNASQRSGDLVFSNCGAIPRELIASELFGHEKGSFTGAVGQKIGLFEQAHDGTLFLDEVTEMPLDQQPALLRVLENQTVTRVGGAETLSVNCRVISATNRTLDELADGSILREDIYYRLAVFPLTIPPLRERRQDIPALATAFLCDLNKEHNTQYHIREQDMDALGQQRWPGNVRELRHAIHRAYIMVDHQSGALSFDAAMSSPFSAQKRSGASNLAKDAIGKTIEEVEQELIMGTLAELNGDKRRAADTLGISLKTLYNRLNEYEKNQRQK